MNRCQACMTKWLVTTNKQFQREGSFNYYFIYLEKYKVCNPELFPVFFFLFLFVCFVLENDQLLNCSNQSQYSFLAEEKSGPSRQICQSTQNRNNNCSNCLHGYCMWAVWLGAFLTSITYAFQYLCKRGNFLSLTSEKTEVLRTSSTMFPWK